LTCRRFAVAVADLALPLALAAVIGREIVAGRNWRNLIVLAMLAVLTLGNAHLSSGRLRVATMRRGATACGSGLAR
jgi:uncharacterized protein involved in response to NO